MSNRGSNLPPLPPVAGASAANNAAEMARAEANAAARAAAAAAPKIYNVGDKIVYRKICLIEGEITHVFREEGKDKNYGYKVKENGSSDSTIVKPEDIIVKRGGRRKSRKSRKLRKTRSNRR